MSPTQPRNGADRGPGSPLSSFSRGAVDFGAPRSSYGRPSQKEDAMKYMLLIHQGTTPTPRIGRAGTPSPRTSRRQVYADYQAINETPGRHARRQQLQPPETATTVRVADGRTLTTDGPFVEIKEAIGGYLLLRGRRPRRRDRARRAHPGGPHGRRDRGPPDRGVVAILEQVFREQWGRVLAALIGFLGDFDLAEEAAQEAFAIAAERWPRDGVPDQPRRLAGHDRAQPGDRPDPPRSHAGREDPPARGAGGAEDHDGRRRPSPTSGSS